MSGFDLEPGQKNINNRSSVTSVELQSVLDFTVINPSLHLVHVTTNQGLSRYIYYSPTFIWQTISATVHSQRYSATEKVLSYKLIILYIYT